MNRYDDQTRQALHATADSRSWIAERTMSFPFPMDVGRDYTINCLTGRHDTSTHDPRCTGWIAPGTYVRQCRCACHEVQRRPSYYEAKQMARGG